MSKNNIEISGKVSYINNQYTNKDYIHIAFTNESCPKTTFKTTFQGDECLPVQKMLIGDEVTVFGEISRTEPWQNGCNVFIRKPQITSAVRTTVQTEDILISTDGKE